MGWSAEKNQLKGGGKTCYNINIEYQTSMAAYDYYFIPKMSTVRTSIDEIKWLKNEMALD